MMGWIKSLSLMLVLCLISFACSKGNQDPLGIDQENELPEGRLTTALGSYGPNVVVSWSNADSASQTINEMVFTVFQKAADAFSGRPSMSEPVRMNGDYNGYAVVDGTSELVGKTVNFELKAIFYDYSDDGSIFIGGSLRYQGPIDVHRVTHDTRVNDEIKFAGPYGGFVRYNNLLLHTDEQGNLVSIFSPASVTNDLPRSGTVTYNSGENNFTLNPYPAPRPPGRQAFRNSG